MRIGIIAFIALWIGLAVSVGCKFDNDNPAPAAPCVEYARAQAPDRFVVLECVEDTSQAHFSNGAAYLYDPVAKKCFLLTGSGRGRSLGEVTCDNLPVPE